MSEKKTVKIEQADGSSAGSGKYHRFLKVQKRRIERHRAKHNPECIPGYGKYSGYET